MVDGPCSDHAQQRLRWIFVWVPSTILIGAAPGEETVERPFEPACLVDDHLVGGKSEAGRPVWHNCRHVSREPFHVHGAEQRSTRGSDVGKSQVAELGAYPIKVLGGIHRPDAWW
jgi:hypothetical protein